MDAFLTLLSNLSISLDLSTLGLLIFGLFWRRQIVYGRKQQVLEQTYVAFMKFYDFMVSVRSTYAHDSPHPQEEALKKTIAAYRFKRLAENSHRTITPFLANRYAFSLYFKEDPLFEEAIALWHDFKEACKTLQANSEPLSLNDRISLEEKAGLLNIEAYSPDTDRLIQRLNSMKGRFDALLAQYL